MKNPLKKLRHIGHTQYSTKGMTTFLCELSTANIELMLLEMIFEAAGDTFEVMDVLDYYENDEITAIKIVTDMPCETYDKHTKPRSCSVN